MQNIHNQLLFHYRRGMGGTDEHLVAEKLEYPRPCYFILSPFDPETHAKDPDELAFE